MSQGQRSVQNSRTIGRFKVGVDDHGGLLQKSVFTR